MKTMLCMLSHPPYTGSLSVELLEAAMVGAVFEFDVSILLRGEAVWILKPGQNGALLSRKTPGNIITALPDYEISNIYACADAMEMRGLHPQSIVVPVTTLNPAEQANLIAAQDIVMSGSA